MVIRGKTSKCGNLLVSSCVLAACSPTTVPFSPHHSIQRCDFPPTTKLLYPPPSLVTLGRFGQHDASPAIQPVFNPTTCHDRSLPLRCVFHPTVGRVVFPHHSSRARACVRRMRACERQPCALVRARSCNNNKKRATL